MASTAAEPNFELSRHLLGETADLRERFERNPLFSRVFADMVEARAYRRLLVAFHGYYDLLETLIRGRQGGKLCDFADVNLNKTAWLERDLHYLETSPGTPAPLAHLPRIRNRAEATGASFVTEYIAWHAEVAEKHLKLALPRDCIEAVHFVSAYGKSREMQWQRFCLYLDSQEWSMKEREQMIRTAQKTLAGMDAWLRDTIQEA